MQHLMNSLKATSTAISVAFPGIWSTLHHQALLLLMCLPIPHSQEHYFYTTFFPFEDYTWWWFVTDFSRIMIVAGIFFFFRKEAKLVQGPTFYACHRIIYEASLEDREGSEWAICSGMLILSYCKAEGRSVWGTNWQASYGWWEWWQKFLGALKVGCDWRPRQEGSRLPGDVILLEHDIAQNTHSWLMHCHRQSEWTWEA